MILESCLLFWATLYVKHAIDALQMVKMMMTMMVVVDWFCNPPVFQCESSAKYTRCVDIRQCDCLYRVAQKVSHPQESSWNRIINCQWCYIFHQFLLQNEHTIKYSMCDLIYDVITSCCWSCDTGNINVYDEMYMKKSWLKTIKKEKYGNNFFT